MKLQDLNKVFEEARKVNASYAGIIVLPTEEAIIFSSKVFDYKQEYINDVYNENLQLKHAKHVQIVDCAYGKTYHDIQVKLKR
ncbi:hypothetical protein [Bacillus gaemokensis]|uniref:Uncharacterized protein n=1 Tax=Bacillus gaemokensis TaxID=574375 RepID=A0A073K9J1_9BACI|nr:hypothetical protein [Bacillus gaemokensis]KEK23924.1 hypothetical protein BAGA_05740 [Bacillus gaemokensis]KYG38047.1 hypothetical protein AZF08_20005 [Bacillus gaemokensis]